MRLCSDQCDFRACGNCPVNVTACDEPQCVVANGYEKSVLTINRMVPGPNIQVGNSIGFFRLRYILQKEPVSRHKAEGLQIWRTEANIGDPKDYTMLTYLMIVHTFLGQPL